MHSRCCWPPDSRSAERSRSPPTSSYSPARRSASVTACSSSGRAPASSHAARRALLGERVGDVVEDAHRERVGLLEDHRHAPAQLVDLELVDVGAVERDSPAARGAGGDLGEAVQRAQQRRLARAGGADQRQHLALAHRQADVAHDPVLAVGQPHRLERACARAPAPAAAWRARSAWSPRDGRRAVWTGRSRRRDVGSRSTAIRRTGGGINGSMASTTAQRQAPAGALVRPLRSSGA